MNSDIIVSWYNLDQQIKEEEEIWKHLEFYFESYRILWSDLFTILLYNNIGSWNILARGLSFYQYHLNHLLPPSFASIKPLTARLVISLIFGSCVRYREDLKIWKSEALKKDALGKFESFKRIIR